MLLNPDALNPDNRFMGRGALPWAAKRLVEGMDLAGSAYNLVKSNVPGLSDVTDSPPEEFNRAAGEMGTVPRMAAQAIRGGARASEALGSGMRGIVKTTETDPLAGLFDLAAAPVVMTANAPGTAVDIGRAIGRGNLGEFVANRSPELLNFLPAIGFLGGRLPIGDMPWGKGSASRMPPATPPGWNDAAAIVPRPPKAAPIEMMRRMDGSFSDGRSVMDSGIPRPPLGPVQAESLPIIHGLPKAMESGIARPPQSPASAMVPPPEVLTSGIARPPAGPLGIEVQPPPIPEWAMALRPAGPVGAEPSPPLAISQRPPAFATPVPAAPPQLASPGAPPSPGALPSPSRAPFPIAPERPFEPAMLEPPPDAALFAPKADKLAADSAARLATVDPIKKYHDLLLKDVGPAKRAKAQTKLIETAEAPPIGAPTPETTKMGADSLMADYPGIPEFLKGMDLSESAPVIRGQEAPIEGPIQFFADLLQGFRELTPAEKGTRPSQQTLGTIAKRDPEAGPLLQVIRTQLKSEDPEGMVYRLGLDKTDPEFAEQLLDKGGMSYEDLYQAIIREADNQGPSPSGGGNSILADLTRMAEVAGDKPVQKRPRNPRQGAIADIPQYLYDLAAAGGEKLKRAIGGGAEFVTPPESFNNPTLNMVANVSKDVGRRMSADISQGVRKAMIDPESTVGAGLSWLEKKFPRVGRTIREFSQDAGKSGTMKKASEIPGEVLKAFAEVSAQSKFNAGTPNSPWTPVGERRQRATQPFSITQPDGTQLAVTPGMDITGHGLDQLPPGKWEHITAPPNPQQLQGAVAGFSQAFNQWAQKVGAARASSVFNNFAKAWEEARLKTDRIHGEQLEKAAKKYEARAAIEAQQGNAKLAADYTAAAANARSPAARFQAYMTRVDQGNHVSPLEFDETYSKVSTLAPGQARFNSGLYRGSPDVEATLRSMEGYGGWAEGKKVIEQYAPALKQQYKDSLVDLWKAQNAKGKASGLLNTTGGEPTNLAQAQQAADLIINSPADKMEIAPEGLPVMVFGKVRIGDSEIQVPARDFHELTFQSQPLIPRGGAEAINTINRIGVSSPLLSPIVGAKNITSNAAALARGFLGNAAEDPAAALKSLKSGIGELVQGKMNPETRGTAEFTLSDSNAPGQGLLGDAYSAQARGAKAFMSGDVAFRNAIKASRLPVTAGVIRQEMVKQGMAPAAADAMVTRTMDAVDRLTSKDPKDVMVDPDIQPWVAKAIQDMDVFASNLIPDPRFAPPGVRDAGPMIRFWTFGLTNKLNSARRIKDVVAGEGWGKKRAALAILTPAILAQLLHRQDPQANIPTNKGGAGPNSIDLGKLYESTTGKKAPAMLKGMYFDTSVFAPEQEILGPMAAISQNFMTGAKEGSPNYRPWELSPGGESLFSEVLSQFQKKYGGGGAGSAGMLARQFIPGQRLLSDAKTLGTAVTGRNPYQRKSGFAENLVGDFPFALDLLQGNQDAEMQALKSRRLRGERLSPEETERLIELAQEKMQDMRFDLTHQVTPGGSRIMAVGKALGLPLRRVEQRRGNK